jgi:hypothetical protein
LGGICCKCGSSVGLQFHLKVGDGRAHHLMSSRDRTYFYLRESVAGNLELHCQRCHGAATTAKVRFVRNQRLFQSIGRVPASAPSAGCSTPQIRSE